MASARVLALVLSAALLAAVDAAAPSFARSLLQAAAAPPPGENGALFDWGRPCTLIGNASEIEITGPQNAACTACGSGATATAEPTCTFKPLTATVGSSINIYYHSSVHHLYIGDAPCVFTTEICPNATADATSPKTPCIYKFPTAGSFVISDKAGKGGADDGEYCTDFGAHLPVTVTTSA